MKFPSASAWLVRARSSIRDRLSHQPLLIFLIVHLTALTLLCLLTLTLRELNASTSHLLRHIIDQANLTDVVFRSPEGRVGDWRDAPAVVLRFDANGSSPDQAGEGRWRLCDDSGKECWDMGDGAQVKQYEGNVPDLDGARFEPSATATSSNVASVSAVVATSSSEGTAALPTTATSSAASGDPSAMAKALFEDDDSDDEDGDEDEDEDEEDEEDEDAAVEEAVEEAEEGGKEEEDEESDSDSDSDADSESSDEDEEAEELVVEAPVSNISNTSLAQVGRSFPAPLARRDISLSVGSQSAPGGNVTVVLVSGVAADDLVITPQCAASFSWAINSLDNLVREEIVLAAFFIWIFVLATIGLFTTSTPHMTALVLSLALSAIWIGVEIHLTRSFWAGFLRMVSTQCAGANVLPDYYPSRIGFQVATLILNLLLLPSSAVMSWRLRDHFGWETFQRIGASRPMKQMYTLVLAMSIVLQLDVFVLITFFALWLAQITYGVTNYYMFRCKSWQAVTALLLVLLLPWLVSGWKCIRQESRLHFNTFMGCSVLLLAGWSASFSHELFRLEFITWPFFGTLGTLGAALTVSSIVLAILRRTTFDRGLADYLKFDMVSDTKAPILAQDKVEPLVLPATSLPTFSSAFPSGPAPPPRAMFPVTVPTAGRPGRNIPSWRQGDD